MAEVDRMKYRFLNRCVLPDNSVGKIIVCKNLDEILLFGKFVKDARIAGDVEKAKKLLESITYDGSLTERVGNHRDILPQGRILGGSQAVVRGDLFFMMLGSTQYGPVNEEVVQRCLGKKYHVEYDCFPEMPLSFEDFLAMSGEFVRSRE